MSIIYVTDGGDDDLALQIAAYFGAETLVRLLLEYGTDQR
jgi:hypothetical protein